MHACLFPLIRPSLAGFAGIIVLAKSLLELQAVLAKDFLPL